MRILISADMEGVSGIVHVAETNPERYDYERGRVLMTAEVNAVIEGVFDAEPEADVLVADAHGTFRNLLPEELDERVRVVRGRPRPLGMMAGLDGRTDRVMFVGYHARAGTGPAVLAHTMSDAVLSVRLNGRTVGEIGLNAALAGHHGAPVALIAGDDVACAELADLSPESVTVPVKEAVGQIAAVTTHPAVTRRRLREAAASAVRKRIAPVVMDGPVALEVDVMGPAVVDLATLIPGARRAPGARTVTFAARDLAEAYQVVALIVALGQVPLR
ncbi:M55 family metallopeptidase [Catenuloplanes atrovinosus]|uniref:D-amino peptidase n=1 Tax=Catenuloplanes atrovinosus TaxID=137266 RepID=A0AAE3YPG9_9ACTN|nr:M55 family metallopeptidase [Catenuloplanes atrovinosus]MDR7276166.1 D-amino peptidase [Catenuloplanes atrovinosus]